MPSGPLESLPLLSCFWPHTTRLGWDLGHVWMDVSPCASCLLCFSEKQCCPLYCCSCPTPPHPQLRSSLMLKLPRCPCLPAARSPSTPLTGNDTAVSDHSQIQNALLDRSGFPRSSLPRTQSVITCWFRYLLIMTVL